MPASPPNPPSSKSDLLFKRFITWSTGACLAAAYGWLAAYDRHAEAGWHFHWRWFSVLWIIIGFGSSAYFWHKIWPPAGPSGSPRLNVLKGLVVFVLPCLYWVIYPLRFLKKQQLSDVLTALLVVAMALSLGAWMIARLVKAFEASDTYDLKALESQDHPIKSDQGGE